MNSPIVHLSTLGILLFVGVVLRTKVGLIKRFFIPASLIAGLIGLGLGEYGLKVLPADMLETFSSLPSMLITIVFAPMLMGIEFPKAKDMANTLAPQLLYVYIGDFLLIAVPLLTTAFLIAPIWNVDEMFGTIIEVGFVGGHGTAGGLAQVYTELGWEEGGSLALTTATIGLFIGIISGMIIINHGVRKGYTSILKNSDSKSSQKHQDLIAKKDQPVGARITINKEVVEPMAFHFGVIALAVMAGVAILFVIETLTGLNLLLFPMAMIGGLLVQWALSKTDFKDSVDRGTLNLIQGLALELLILSAITTIKIPVVLAYAMPLLLIIIASVLALLVYFYFLGPRLFKTEWFEHAIVNFGTLSGVAAVGLMLLRTVDPEMKSEAVKAFAMRAPFVAPFIGGGLLTTVLPLLIINYGAAIVGIGFLLACIVLLIIARAFGYWGSPTMKTDNL
ncbi:MAG: sodium/glutamate symporter [Gammaproteobacteria bacterium]|nr:sodium/glutamate symporter [Gammaproteobacteria bacterium]